MNLLSFVATVVLLTASGALAPGPLFFVTVSHGAKSGARSGLIFSVAHSLIEFSLIMFLAAGLLAVASEPLVKLAVGITGGTVLVAFGAMQVRNALSSRFGERKTEEASMRSLMLIGLIFTGLNPFFVVWWLTVGAHLILIALEFASLAGVVLMYVCHVWMDYVWLTAVAHLSKIGMNVAGLRWYRIMMAVFGVVLVYFGITFLRSSLGAV